MNMEGYTPGEPVVETPADAWMFSRLAKAVKMVTEGIENYTFGDMARGVQQFFWNEVCDWYVEVTKARLKGEGRLQAQRNLIFVLRYLHSPDASAYAVCHRGDLGQREHPRRACSTWMPRATLTAPRRS